MASDTTTVKLDGDASGLKGAAKEGQAALGGLGKTADTQSQKLGLYGEKLGKAFGPGEGLHGRLDSLETPIRDSEGAFMRAQQAVLAFGNDGATATDKISAGFLLASDSISSFTSGGMIGFAVAGVVALGAAIYQTFSAADEEAEEAAKSFEDLAKAAAEAQRSITGSYLQENIKRQQINGRAAEEELRIARRNLVAREGHVENQEKILRNAASASSRRLAKAELEERKKRLAKGKRIVAELEDRLKQQAAMIVNAARMASDQMERDATGAITTASRAADAIIKETEKFLDVTADAVEKKSQKTIKTFGEVLTEYAAREKELTESQQELRKESEAFDDRLAERREERAKAARQRMLDSSEDFHSANLELYKERLKEEQRLANVQKKIESDLSSARMNALSTFTSGLFDMAHTGEVSFAKLADSVIASTGKQLVSRGTLHLFEGLAATFSGNPAGAAQSAVGGKMIAAGLVMGAAGGAIGRAGAPPSEEKTATPTDTRKSAAASSSSGGSGGGTTVINFNGPAYDKRGVSQVITSGQRMAKHRRVQGA